MVTTGNIYTKRNERGIKWFTTKKQTHTQAVIQENEGQKKLLDIQKTNSKMAEVNSYQKLL